MALPPKTSFSIVRPSWRALQVLTLVSVLLCVGVVYVATWGNSVGVEGLGRYLPGVIQSLPAWDDSGPMRPAGSDDHHKIGGGKGQDDEVVEGHPIVHLMKAARKQFQDLVKEEAKSLEDAAKKYRERRGRHPPPGFDAWYTYATENGAVLVESFFDQIYADLAPFGGSDPRMLRQIAHAFSPKITIRNGKVDSETKNNYKTLQQVVSMLQSLPKHPQVQLPDIELPLNVNEEPALLVPWETVDTATSLSRRVLPESSDVIEEFTPLDVSELEYVDFTFDPEWKDARLTHPGSSLGPRPLWSLVQPACPPDSPARNSPLLEDIWHKEGHTKEEHSASAMLPLEAPTNTLEGYVKNWTMATDACLVPELQGLHGAFVAPEGMAVSQKLFPLLSASKMGMSSEILIPGVGDWNASDYSSDDSPLSWEEKQDRLFWRGTATGGKSSEQNWQRFHRHRFVAMLNATHIEIAEALLHAGNESMIGLGYAKNFRLLPGNDYHLASQKGGNLAEWINSWADVAFTDLRCGEGGNGNTCPYLDEFFSVRPESEPNDQARHKYAAVLDGNGGDDGGAFLDHLRSGSVVLKASIYQQWYDTRLIPWLHFVPLDNLFADLHGVMEYFLGAAVREKTQFAHAHVEMEKHEHHFQTPHWDVENGVGEEEKHEHHEIHEHDHEPDGTMKRSEGAGAAQDAAAKKIAETGNEWASKVLRKEDMLIYVYRLLLEYARMVDDKRERLGWVQDLVEAIVGREGG